MKKISGGRRTRYERWRDEQKINLAKIKIARFASTESTYEEPWRAKCDAKGANQI